MRCEFLTAAVLWLASALAAWAQVDVIPAKAQGSTQAGEPLDVEQITFS